MRIAYTEIGAASVPIGVVIHTARGCIEGHGTQFSESHEARRPTYYVYAYDPHPQWMLHSSVNVTYVCEVRDVAACG